MKLSLFNRKILSIDFGSTEIKIMQGQASKKGINLLKATTVNLPKDAYYDGQILDELAITTAFKKTLADNKITTDLAYGTINSSSIITREVTIPKVDSKEIQGIIGYQLEEYLPVDPDDYVVESMVVGTSKEMDVEKVNVLLIAIPKKMVLDHLSLMKAVGLKPQVLDYQGNSMAKLLDYNSSANNNYNTKGTTIASIDMGYSNSKLTIVKDGNIEVTRVIDGGAKTLYDNVKTLFDYSIDEIEERVREIIDINDRNDNDEELIDYKRLLNITKTTLDSIMEKTDTVFKYYTSRETGNDINFILLQGGLSNINGVDNLFSNYFNIPAVKLSSLDKIKWDGDLSKYSNAIGGLIRVQEVQK